MKEDVFFSSNFGYELTWKSYACRAPNSRFDPLQKRRQSERRSHLKSNSSESQQSEAKQRFDPLGKKKERGGLTPLPAQKGKKAQKQNPSGDSANKEQAFAAQLGKLMQELAVGKHRDLLFILNPKL